MLQLHASGRIEPLALALAGVLSDAPSDPMSPEWIAVPSEGMRRWLSLELARHLGASGPRSRDGVAANITSAFPGSLRTRVLEGRPRNSISDAATDTGDDPWSVDRLVWSVLDALLRNADDPLITPLLDLPSGSSRFGRARRVADLFDRYHVHRPAMVRAWANGDDTDPAGRPLLRHHRWQAHLWRLVRADIAVPSPAERLPGMIDALRAGELVVDLPDRVLLFGLTLLPGGAGFLELADALAVSHDVHLFLLEPSPASARRVVEQLSPPTGPVRLRADDPTAASVEHPLVRSWGRLHRETTVLLADAATRGLPTPQPVAEPTTRRRAPVTVLSQLHDDIAADRAPAGDLVPLADDRSVQFHACHGTTRQVEVLRDVLMHLLADDELALREDDLLVVCPDLERFAPVIEAVFGPSVDDPSRHRSHDADAAPPPLRYRIADRSIRDANPVLAATTALLDLVAGRFDAPSVLDFVSLGPVRERFRFSDDDLARLADWVDATNVRWGLDAAHRQGAGVPASITNNTWQAATDRLLLGAAVLEDDRTLAVGDVAPYGIESDDVVVAGRLADLLWQLGELAAQTAVPRPVGEWIELLRANVAALFRTDTDTEWQLESMLRLLGEIVESAEGAGGVSVELDFVDLRRLLSDRLEAAPGRPDFFRGGITISSMTPLRWVPHRAVVLLGADQAAFGAGAVDGDDLAAAVPLLGDRDSRGESRQSLLEAVLAARDRLVLIRDGHDVRTNHEVPPAVAVAELRDVLVAMVEPSHREELARRLEVHHPRQPFDERCYTPGAILGSGAWSFDPTALRGAEARRDRRTSVEPFLDAPFERDDAEVIELAELQSFMKDPVKYFLQRRLGLRLPRREDGVSPLLPVGLDGLEQWNVGDRLLSARLAGVSVEDWCRVERRLGTLPPASLGDALVDSVVDDVEQLVSTAVQHGLEPGRADRLPVEAVLGDGTRVIGTVLGRLGGEAPGPVRLSYSKDRPAFRLPAWIDLLALAATQPGGDQRAVGVYRSRVPNKPPVVIDLAVDGDPEVRRAAAVAALEVVVGLFRAGTAEPLPIFEYLTPLLHLGKAGADDWRRPAQYGGGGDGDRPPARMVFGDHDFDTLTAIPVAPYDPPAPLADTDRRAERLAHVIWHAYETSVVDRNDPADAS